MEDKLCKKHFVLIHGGCHGAWCWFMLKPLIESKGHRVTAVDMAASGTDLTKIDELQTFRDYSEPLIQLMAALGDDEKVIVVGHSLGGINIALAMEMFPHKIEVAVFLSAFMPDSRHPPSFVIEQLFESVSPEDYMIDTKFKNDYPNESFTSFLFGPQFLSKMYSFSTTEHLGLANTLKRPSSFFLDDLRKEETKLSKEKYGSVKRVFVVTDKDEAIPQSYQRWMIENDGVKEVRMLHGSDHVPMISVPKQLCNCLLEIAQNCN